MRNLAKPLITAPPEGPTPLVRARRFLVIATVADRRIYEEEVMTPEEANRKLKAARAFFERATVIEEKSCSHCGAFKRVSFGPNGLLTMIVHGPGPNGQQVCPGSKEEV